MLRAATPFFFQKSQAKHPTCKGAVRVATLEDIPNILDIMEKTFITTYHDENHGKCCFNDTEIKNIIAEQKEKYQKTLCDENHLTLVSCAENKIVGFARIVKMPQFAYLDKLYVLPEYHHTPEQHGKYLMLSSLASADSYFNQRVMRLEVWGRNTHAIKFYEANQFKKLEMLPPVRVSSVDRYDGFYMQCNDVVDAASRLEAFMQKSKANQLV